MKFPVFVPLLLISGQAFAMPCDSSYLCTSARGKYKIDIQRCRYDNRLGNIGMLQIGGKDVTGATLGPAFDGDDFGAFEIDLPQQGDTQRHPLGRMAEKDPHRHHPGQVAQRESGALPHQLLVSDYL